MHSGIANAYIRKFTCKNTVSVDFFNDIYLWRATFLEPVAWRTSLNLTSLPVADCRSKGMAMSGLKLQLSLWKVFTSPGVILVSWFLISCFKRYKLPLKCTLTQDALYASPELNSYRSYIDTFVYKMKKI